MVDLCIVKYSYICILFVSSASSRNANYKGANIKYPDLVPSGADTSIKWQFYHWLLLFALGLSIVNAHWNRTSDGFFTIFTSWIWYTKTYAYYLALLWQFCRDPVFGKSLLHKPLKRENLYHFFPTNLRLANTNIYSSNSITISVKWSDFCITNYFGNCFEQLCYLSAHHLWLRNEMHWSANTSVYLRFCS